MLSAGGAPVVPFARRDRGRGQSKTLRPKCSRPAEPLWSLLPEGTAEGDKAKHSGQNALGRRTPCGPFCQKGPRKGTNQNTPAKMPSAGGPPVVPFAKRDRGRGQTKTLRPKCPRPADPLWSLLPKGTAEGDKPKHSGQNALGRRTPCGPFCQKGPRKGTNQNTPAKMPSAGGPPVVPFAKRDRGWNHYRDSISVVPFAKRDRGTPHKCKRDRGWSHYLDSISVVPFCVYVLFCGPFCQKGPRKWSHDNGSNCGPFCPFVFVTPFLWSLLPKGTTEMESRKRKGKRDHSWNHYHGSISAVPFGKRDHRTRHKRKKGPQKWSQDNGSNRGPFCIYVVFRGPFWQKGPQKWSHDNGS